MAVIWVDCSVCKGAGLWLVNGKVVICTNCSGTGEVRQSV